MVEGDEARDGIVERLARGGGSVGLVDEGVDGGVLVGRREGGAGRRREGGRGVVEVHVGRRAAREQERAGVGGGGADGRGGLLWNSSSVRFPIEARCPPSLSPNPDTRLGTSRPPPPAYLSLFIFPPSSPNMATRISPHFCTAPDVRPHAPPRSRQALPSPPLSAETLLADPAVSRLKRLHKYPLAVLSGVPVDGGTATFQAVSLN